MSGTELRHRLVAILAADAAEYSRHMAADERATLAALDAARAVFRGEIESRQGRVIDMAGDSVLAAFDTAAGAVEAAIAVQQALAPGAGDRPLRYRIGVHVGDVMEKADGTIYGDGVNVAARVQTLADAGGITVSDAVKTALRGKVVSAFEDQGNQPVKNLPDPVHAYRIPLAGANIAAAAAKPVAALEHKPSVAVLPFNNMSRDPEQDYFGDGLSEDIITALAAWRSFPVIARNSTFAFKGRSPDVRQVAKELGASYVLEGSVRKAGNSLRITAQLIDGSTGNHVWAHRYDRTLDDIFAVQDEITARIVAAIEPALETAEIRRIAQHRAGTLGAWDCYVRGLATMRSYGRNREETKRLFEQSLAGDPAFADAMLALALCHSADIYAARAENVPQAIAAMFDLANRALQIDPQNFRVYLVLCLAHFWRGELKQSVEAGRKAVALNPSSADAHMGLAAALSHFGLFAEAEQSARMCLKLSPIDPGLHRFHTQLVQALLGQRRFAEAHEHLEQSLAARPNDLVLLGFRTVLLGHLGRLEEARKCLEAYLAARGLTSAEEYRRLFVRNSALTEINLEGLRAAGWNV